MLLKYPACIMPCISFMNGILSWTKKTFLMPFHSWFISLILESWYSTNICMGPLMLMVHGGMVTAKKLLAPQNVKLQNYFDQLKSMSMWATNHNTLWSGHVLWLWCHGFWWCSYEFYDKPIEFKLNVYEHKFMKTIWRL